MKLVKVPGVNGLGKTKGTRDFGDLIVDKFDYVLELNNDNVEEQQAKIYDKADEYLHEPLGVIFVGGDHSISYPSAKAFFDKYGHGKLIVFDAHPDCMPFMKEPTHEEWLRALVEQGVRGDDILLIGARKIEPEEGEFLNLSGIRTISVDQVRFDLGKSLRWVREFVRQGEIYVSFDIDVFDSSIVKATGYPESGGLNETEVSRLLEVIKEGNVVAGDLVEGNVDFPKEDVVETVRVARGVLDKLGK
ncbi:MAG: arginase family protein [archaeon]